MTFADDLKTVDDGDVTVVLQGGSLRLWAHEEGIFVWTALKKEASMKPLLMTENVEWH